MNENKKLVDKTIKEYLKKKIKEAFTDDYALIEPQMENLTEKYSLKELIIIVRVEIDKIKNREAYIEQLAGNLYLSLLLDQAK